MSGPSTPDPLLGRELDGYVIDELLGQGGMARVYRGRDIRLNRHVAIKVIQPDARSESDYAFRFEREARAVAQLEHQHIVSVYRFGEVAGLYYMAMQYIEGTDLSWVLSDYAADGELLPHEDVLRIVSQIGSALDYAHSRGVIHRDVKPSNIMLTNRGDAILTDFGLVLLQIEGTRGEIFGTPHYIAPEQAINSAGAVPQSDIYALGIVLYEMLTGRVPFDEGSALDIAMAHMTEAPPHPLQVNPDLPPAFLPVLDTALAKEPSERYQTGAALADGLQQAMAVAAGAPPHDRMPTTQLLSLYVPDKVSKFRQNNPLPPLPPQPAPPTIPAQRGKEPESSASFTRLTQSSNRVPAKTKRGVRRRPGWLLIASATIVITVLLCIAFMLTLLAANPQSEADSTPSLVAVETTAATSTEVAVASIIESPTPSETPVAESTVEPTPTLIPVMTATPPVVAMATTPVDPVIELRFATNGEDSLYIMNESVVPFPLAPLAFRTVQGMVQGTEWDSTELQPQECVRVQKEEDSDGPEVVCTPVGTIVTRDGEERFWSHREDTFAVFYANEHIGDCDTSGCIMSINIQNRVIPLQFATNRDRSLYIINIGTDPLPLFPLELRGEDNVRAEEWWEVPALNPQECIRLQKNERSDPPDITCTPVGEIIKVGGRDRFWNPENVLFAVYYENRYIGDCESTGCSLTFTPFN